MNINEKKALTLTLVDNDATATESVLGVYLTLAQNAILNKMYPSNNQPESVTDVPTKYEVLQCQLAARYFLRRGSEGETAHNENGINRTYGSSDDSDLLRQVVQIAKVV